MIYCIKDKGGLIELCHILTDEVEAIIEIWEDKEKSV